MTYALGLALGYVGDALYALAGALDSAGRRLRVVAAERSLSRGRR